MDLKTNRKLHALANGIAPGEAHEFLKTTAKERYGTEYRDLSPVQCVEFAKHLREVKERVRTGIYQALHNSEDKPISEAQISQVKQFQRLLGWQDYSIQGLIINRYNETNLESMPLWKGVRLVAYLEKRWHSKNKKKITETQSHGG